MLTDVLGSFVHAFSLKFSVIYDHAVNLLYILIVIEVAIFGIYYLLQGGDLIASAFKKILVIGAFQFLITQYAWLVDAMMRSFVLIGLVSSPGEKAIPLASFLDPSYVIDLGWQLVFPILDRLSLMAIIYSLGFGTLLQAIAAVLILLCFVGIGVQVFMTVVEYYIITTLGIILLPFGLFKPTAFLADKVIGSIFTVCVKLMVLAFCVSAAFPILEGLKPEFCSGGIFSEIIGDSGIDWEECSLRHHYTLLVGVWAVRLVIKKAPEIALSMMSGSSGMDAGHVFQPIKAVGKAVMMAGLFKFGGAFLKTGSGGNNTGNAAGAASGLGGGSNKDSAKKNASTPPPSSGKSPTSGAHKPPTSGSDKK